MRVPHLLAVRSISFDILVPLVVSCSPLETIFRMSYVLCVVGVAATDRVVRESREVGRVHFARRLKYQTRRCVDSSEQAGNAGHLCPSNVQK